MKVKTINEFIASNSNPEILFWVGCAGSFDDRYKKVTKAFVRIFLSSADYNVTTQKHIESVIRKKYKPEAMWVEVDVQNNIEDLSLSGKTEYVTDLTAIWADLTQAYLMILLLVSNQGSS